MKKLIERIIVILAIAITIFAALTVSGQKATKLTLALNKGKIEVKDTTKKAKAPDPVYQVVNGITVYKGAKGGLYYWKNSQKTGQPYKCYLKTK